MEKILVTDSLFIHDEHVDRLKEAGFEVERLDVPKATDEELVKHLQGKSGYILGGIEQVSKEVIASTDKLRAISFTGADYHFFVPGYEEATKRGIAVANCPGANSEAVAEFTFALMISMTRDLFSLGRTGDDTFKTTPSLLGSKVGLVGMGFIGERVARMLKGFGVKDISYWNRTRKDGLESELGIQYVELDELIKNSDIVSLHTSQAMGAGYFDAKKIGLMKDGATLINMSFETAVDLEALYLELMEGRLRAAQDGEVNEKRFKELPLYTWFSSNAHTAYNTFQANKLASDIATNSMINLLTIGDDQYVINPDFKQNT